MHPAEGKAERTRVAGSSSHWGCQRAVPTPTSTSRSARLRVARRTPDAPSTPAQTEPSSSHSSWVPSAAGPQPPHLRRSAPLARQWASGPLAPPAGQGAPKAVLGSAALTSVFRVTRRPPWRADPPRQLPPKVLTAEPRNDEMPGERRSLGF